MLVCGFLFFNLIVDAFHPTAGISLFAVTIFALTFIYLNRSGFKQSTRSSIVLVLAAVSAIQFLIFDYTLVSFLNFIFLAMLFVYWVMTVTDRSITGALSIFFAGDVVAQGLVVPFRNFGTGITALSRVPKKGNVQRILLGVLGIVLFLPLLVAVVSLLMSADLAFETFLTGVFDSVHARAFTPYLWQFILGIPVALYLFGLIFGNIKQRYTDTITTESMTHGAQMIRIAPPTMIVSALVAFCLIYLLFFIIQAGYLFSAFDNVLPGAYTYAEYARRGFFELCAVAGINLLVLAIAHLLTARKSDDIPHGLRVTTIIISIFTLLLIVTALSKMVMYIDSYGLTQLRVYTSWFMILLVLIFSTILIRQFRSFNGSRVVIVGFVVLFLVLAYGNIDGVIARYNIDKYEAEKARGIDATLDINTLIDLSDAAIPHLYELSQRLELDDPKQADLNSQIEELILEKFDCDDPDRVTFRSYNYQRSRAEQIRKTLDIKR